MSIGTGGGAPGPVNEYGTNGPPPKGTIIGTGGAPGVGETKIGIGGAI